MEIKTMISYQLIISIYLIQLYGVLSSETPQSVVQNDPYPYHEIGIDENIRNYHAAHIPNHDDFYDFDVVDIRGHKVSLDEFRGMVTLVVNVASECGYTDSHYKSLIRLQNVLGRQNKFKVLAFPCNQFGSQEPGTRDDIIKITEGKYHVNFPVFDKVNVLPPGASEPWDYLIGKSGAAPNWNFWKYLVDEDGHVLYSWGPWSSVEDIYKPIKEAVDKISSHAYFDEL